MAAGLIDRLEVTLFPVVSGRTGTSPVFGGADDFDLELLEAGHSTAARSTSFTTPPHTDPA